MTAFPVSFTSPGPSQCVPVRYPCSHAFPGRLVRSRVLPAFPSRLDAFPMSFPGRYITGRPGLIRSSRPSLLPGLPPVLFSFSCRWLPSLPGYSHVSLLSRSSIAALRCSSLSLLPRWTAASEPFTLMYLVSWPLSPSSLIFLGGCTDEHNDPSLPRFPNLWGARYYKLFDKQL